MTPGQVLDKKLLERIKDKCGLKSIQSAREKVSREARKLSISPEAALVKLCKDHDIGCANYMKKLGSPKQTEIREVLISSLPKTEIKGSSTKGIKTSTKNTPSKRAMFKKTIEALIMDDQLLGRCQDLLLAKNNFDRAINQATLVLEERIRGKAALEARLVGEPLVNAAFKEDLAKTVLEIASKDKDDQRGFTQILRGFVPAFRNTTHHFIDTGFSRVEALRVCSFIDLLLKVVDQTNKVR